MTKPPAMPELPDLPKRLCIDDDKAHYSADQMRAYALAALQSAQPAEVSDAEIVAAGHRTAWRYKHSSDPAHSSTYTFNLACLLRFARAILAQRPAEQADCVGCEGKPSATNSPCAVCMGAQQVTPERAPVTWPKARDVGRFGDMSKSAHMRVGLDSDNDVYVSVWGEDGGGSVEFCNPGGGGGGSSRRTREALIALMVAMEADNAERPDKDWWVRRNGTAQAKDAAHQPTKEQGK